MLCGVDEMTRVRDILSELNKFDESLKFTHELEVDKSINYLDVTIIRQDDGCSFRHFIKPTQTTRTLPYTSAHPKSVFKGRLRELWATAKPRGINSNKKIE